MYYVPYLPSYMRPVIQEGMAFWMTEARFEEDIQKWLEDECVWRYYVCYDFSQEIGKQVQLLFSDPSAAVFFKMRFCDAY